MKTLIPWLDIVLALVALTWVLSPGPTTAWPGVVAVVGVLWALTAAWRLAGRLVPRWLSLPGWAFHAPRALASAAWLFAQLTPWGFQADRPAWFATLAPLDWFYLVYALALHAWALEGVLRTIGGADPLGPAATRSWNLQKLSQIRAKLLGTFLALVVLLTITLTTVLLGRYENSLTRSVADAARIQSLEAASVYKAVLGDEAPIVVFDFLRGQNRVNQTQAVPYRTFRFYSAAASKYRIDDPVPTDLPALKAEFASDRPDARFPELPSLKPEEVSSLLTQGTGDGWLRGGERWFAAPITVAEFVGTGTAKTKHQRLIGLAVLTFSEDDILAPFFLARTAAILVAAVILYVAVVLVFLLGTLIVSPLLILRSQVRSVSTSLETMVKGQRRVSADHLRFDPRINSRDEIQHLSGEIGHMVTVIRGMLPYVSASTLRSSGEEAPSDNRRLTFLFTDIRGFTSLCEGMAPRDVVNLLNRYLDLQTEVILNHGGDVDKFVGDEMMAFFDGPDQEVRACRAALELRKALQEESAQRRAAGLKAVELGIGVHAGEVVFGSVGAKDRRDFTSIGDAVNLAARLEGANKAYQSQSLISGEVQSQTGNAFVWRELDRIRVVGKTEPVPVYELLAETGKNDGAARDLAHTFAEARALYLKQDWKGAQVRFEAIEGDGPSRVLARRSAAFAANPPAAGWDGVHSLDGK